MITMTGVIAEWVARAMLWLSAVMLLLMACHVTVDVLSRYLFNAPLAATLEIGTYYYMVAASFLALAYAQIRDQNISVDLLVHGVRPKIRMLAEFAALAISLVYGLVFTWASLSSALDKTRRGEFRLTQYFDLAVWPSRWILVASGVAFCLVLLAQLLRMALAISRDEDAMIVDLVPTKMAAH